MHFSTLLAGLLAARTLASPIGPSVASVRDAQGNIYNLPTTEPHQIRAFTGMRDNGYYIRPVSYSIRAGYMCKFYRCVV